SLCTHYVGPMANGAVERLNCDVPVRGRYVSISKIGNQELHFCEVEVLIPARGDRLTDFRMEVFMENPETSKVGHLCRTYSGTMPGGATEKIWCLRPIRGRYFQVLLPGNETLALCEVEVLVSLPEGDRLANFRMELFMDDPEQASSTGQLCRTYSGTIAQGATEKLMCVSPQRGRYFQITLPGTQALTLCEVEVLASPDEGSRLADFRLEVFMDDPQSAGSTAQLCASYTGAMPGGATERILCTSPQRGRYFQVTLSSTEPLTLCEVQVLASHYEGERLVDFYVEVFAENPETAQDPGVLCYHYTDAVPGGATVTIHCPQTTNGRYVADQKDRQYQLATL
ncbi:hypothetical protein BaRGS_00029914, partial [Batillaria attramentaria]